MPATALEQKFDTLGKAKPMSWTYQQSTGKLLDPVGEWIGTGYSGHGSGLNNPAMEAVPEIGPIPTGTWLIGAAATLPILGRLVMPLSPVDFDPHGRAGFFMHGDSAAMDHTASCGCIVIGPADRQQVAEGLDRRLEVIP